MTVLRERIPTFQPIRICDGRVLVAGADARTKEDRG
jgi:hypothetical protein